MKKPATSSLPLARARIVPLELGALGAAAPLGLVVVAAWLLSAWTNGGYPATRWGPIGLGLSVALVLALLAVPVDIRGLGKARLIAVGALAAFLLFSYLSIVWADRPGDAWTGADRGFVAIVSFFAFALWPWSARGVTAILTAFTLGVSVSAAVELVRIVASSDPARFFEDGRLVGPIGYANGTVALWMLAFWPAIHLGSTRAAARWVRPAALAGATLLLDIAVLGESRAWPPVLIASAVVFILLARQRLRWLLGLALVTAFALAALPFLVDVFEARADAAALASAADRAVLASLATAAGAAVAGAVWTRLDERVRLSAGRHRALGIVAAAAVALGVAAAVSIGVARIGDPVDWARAKWNDFAYSYSFGEQGSRFGGSLSGQRYEEWRIAWGQFLDDPLLGAGPDNFAAAYLANRKDNFHEPRHPHSLPLRFLSQAGILGTLLFVVGLGAAVYAALKRRRRLDAAAGGSVAAALAVGAYWLLHGSVDILWEIPAVSAPVLGLLGLAASRTQDERPPERPRRSRAGLAATAAPVLALAGIGVMLVLPWLSSVYASAGARVWRADPGLAYDRLEQAASLAPLSAEPLVIEGSIALRRGDLARARETFRRALERDPESWYAYLELGLLEGSLGRYSAAKRYLADSLRLNPNDRVTRLAWRLARDRKPIDPEVLNRVFTDRTFLPPGIESFTHEVTDPL